MGARDRHVGKSVMDKIAYNKYLGQAPFEPTAEDKTNFLETNKAGEELSEPTVKRSRYIPFKQKIGIHFQEQWPYWVVGIGLFLLTTFAFSLALNLNTIGVETQNNSKSIDEIKGDIKTLGQENHSRDLAIQEQRYRIDSLKEAVGTKDDSRRQKR